MQTIVGRAEPMENAIRRACRSPKPWTPEESDQLRKLITEGKTMREAGAAIGRSRNACIGMAHRLGLVSVRSVPRSYLKHRKEMSLAERLESKPKKEHRPAHAPSMPSSRVGFILPALPVPVPLSGPAVGLLDVTGCKWPIHEDASLIGGYAFCNHSKGDGSSYCEYHAREAVADYSRALIRKTIKSLGPTVLRFDRRAA